ncbi:hypothetical protein LTR37_012302 [Vermiconidia calcicola]|uniref:Uncharacterized protein n=1 Tax=Vermiconidia calcicola TaxID=1690605 RepID=A0ACC3MZL6_9PEZI|nr:hypothetical protein LTR37_012302 [Vermiconidia calcicola]
MPQTAREADKAFRPTLDQGLLTIIFEVGSVSANVENAVVAAVEKHAANSDPVALTFVHQTAARTLRVIILSWRTLPGVGEEYEGHEIDRYDYMYTAHQRLESKSNEPESLEYQVNVCLTRELKEGPFTSGRLQGIVDGASKAYLKLMEMIDAAEEAGVVLTDIGYEPEARPATYEADLRHPSPGPPEELQRNLQRKAVPSRSDEKEPVAGSSVDVAQGVVGVADLPRTITNRKPTIDQRGLRFGGNLTLDSFTSNQLPQMMGTMFNPQGVKNSKASETKIKWSKEENHWAEQRLRENPAMTWGALENAFNQRFQNTEYTDEKGTITRGVRTDKALSKRFEKFRTGLKKRKKNNQPTQGTESDVELEAVADVPDNDAKAEGDEGDVEGDEEDVDGGEEDDELVFAQASGKQEQGEAEAPDSDEDPAWDLNEIARRMDEEIGEGEEDS